MKNVFLVLPILFVVSQSFHSRIKTYPLMQVEIYSGKTEWGEQALVLTRDGLILRSSPILGSSKTIFIKIDAIESEYLTDLNMFLMRNEYLMQLKEQYASDLNAFYEPRKYFLRSYNESYVINIRDKDYYKYQEKDYPDRVILDSLVILTNRLIPRKNKQDFSFKDFSNIREVIR